MKPPDSNRPTMYCRKCFYVLDGLQKDRCPECGRQFDRSNPKTYRDRPRRRWRIRQLLRGLVITATALVVLFISVWLVWDVVPRHQLRNELALIRNAGQPLTFDELLARTEQVDAETDAGSLYADALSMLRAVDVHESAYEKAAETWPITRPDRSAANRVRQLLSDNQRSLQLIDEAAGRRACWYEIGIRDPATLQTAGPWRRAALLLRLRTRDLAFGRDGDAAVASMIIALQMLRVFDNDPVLITYLVRISILAIVCRDTVLVLELTEPSEQSLDRLQVALESAERPDLFVRCMLGERIFGMQMVKQQQLRTGPVGRSILVGYLRDMAKIINACDNPWPQAHAAMIQIKPGSIYGSISLPALVAAHKNAGHGLALLRSTRVAVMIERQRRTHGRLPDQLVEINLKEVDPIPLDPFTGKSLLYKVQEGSYVVYSVGHDLTDDGGAVARRGPDFGVRVRFADP